MPPSTEIMTFVVSDAFRTDPQVVTKPILGKLLATPGMLSAYHGLQVEDSSNGYVFVNWATYEDHKRVMDAPNYQTEVVDAVKPIFGGPFEMVHVNFKTDPSTVFESPVVSVVFLTLNPGVAPDLAVEALDKITALEAEGLLAGTYGQTIEKPNVFVTVVGFESVEAHKEHRTKISDEAKALLDNFKAKATLSTGHVKLTKAKA